MPDYPTIECASQDAWEAWLREHHDGADGVWIRIAKKGSGLESVTQAEAVEVALCYGWIDGQARRVDDAFFVQKFTPRRRRSIWSRVNVEKANALIAAGRMQPAGLREVDLVLLGAATIALVTLAVSLISVVIGWLRVRHASKRSSHFPGTGPREEPCARAARA